MPSTEEVISSISGAEKRVLEVLWEQAPLSAEEIINRIKESGSSHPKTVRTLISRLLKKEAIDFEERDRKYHYFALVGQEEFFQHKSRNFLDEYFGGQLSPLVSLFSQGGDLSDKDLQELRKLLDEKESSDE